MSVAIKTKRKGEHAADSERDLSGPVAGWRSVQLGEVADINPRHPRNLGESQLVTFVPMTALSEKTPEFDRSDERPLKDVRKGYTHFAEGDVLFAKITPCMENGKGAVATGLKNRLGCGTTELHVIRPFGNINPRFIYRFLQQELVRRAAAENFTGTAGQLRVPASFVFGLEVPIPPLAEQCRIVARLDVLLGKASASQQRLSRVPVLLERFRQSVLSSACSGKLTADWREEHVTSPATYGVAADSLPDNWRRCRLRELATMSSGEAFKKSEYSDAGARLLQIANVSFSRIIWDQQKFLPASYLDTRPDLVLRDGDILLALNRPLLNWRIKVARVSGDDLPAILYQRVGRFRFLTGENVINRGFFYLFLQSFEFIHELNARLRGTDQPYVNPPEMLEISFPLPPIDEQNEVVRRVAKLFAFADQIEGRLKAAQTHVDRLTQSILAKAFRGELVPQNPNDEPASVLLERIRATRVASPSLWTKKSLNESRK